MFGPTFIKIIIAIVVVSLILSVVKRTKPISPTDSYSDITVEGLSFKNIPADLIAAMKKIEKGKIPPYSEIKSLQSKANSAPENSETLLALTWVQIKIVESGIHIDDLQSDFDVGYAYYEKYFETDEQNISDSASELGDRLDILGQRLQNMPDL